MMRYQARVFSTAIALSVGSAAAAASDLQLPVVRVVEVSRTHYAPEVRLAGEIQARIQTNLSFRITGKIINRLAEVGDHVAAEQVLAIIDPRDQKADAENAKAAVAAAEALLVQAKTNFERQQALIETGFTTRAAYDQSKATLDANSAQLDSAREALRSAEEQLSYTELKAGAGGIIVGRDAEIGEVVQPGKTVFTLAEDGERDAVFNIYESLISMRPRDLPVDIILQSDPSVHATAVVREVSPTVDPKAGTVKVKLGVISAPPQMTLGAGVTGIASIRPREAIILPWSALFEWDGKPSVWVLEKGNSVSPRAVSIDSFATREIAVASGLEPGERVVTAGVQFLRPGLLVEIARGDWR
jgi:membrane fusion protein, multidrug efflux system